MRTGPIIGPVPKLCILQMLERGCWQQVNFLAVRSAVFAWHRALEQHSIAAAGCGYVLMKMLTIAALLRVSLG